MPENKNSSWKKKKLSCFAGLPFNLNQTEITSLCILWRNLDVLKSIYLLLNFLPAQHLQEKTQRRVMDQIRKERRPRRCARSMPTEFLLSRNRIG